MVTLECVEKLIRKDMVDPVNGETLTERDIIVLQRVSCRCPALARAVDPFCSPTQHLAFFCLMRHPTFLCMPCPGTSAPFVKGIPPV